MRLTASRVSITSSGGAVLDAIQQEDPTLDLNFEETKTLTDDVSGTNLITFSRASSGTYVDSDGLIKTSPVNLLTYSEQFDQWTVGLNTTVSPNVAVAPDGTQTADRLQNGSQSSTFIGNGTINNGVTYTVSVYAKAVTPGTNDKFTLNVGGDTANSSSQFTTTSEWQRFVFTRTVSSVSPTPYFFINNEGDGFASDIYIWGAQLEEGSTATTYIPTTTSASGAPRFDHDPVTGESLGLLIEEARTNLFPYSTDFSQGYGNSNTTLTANTTTAPDGTTTASTLTVSTGSSYSYMPRSISTANGTSYSLSYWVKYNNCQYVWLLGAEQPDVFAYFDLINGVVGAANGYNCSMTPYPDGWYRITATKTKAGATATEEIAIGITRSSTSPTDNQAGDAVYLWGAQFETGTFPTSYIPTSGSTVTRAADLASIEGTNFSSWFNSSELQGTVFSEVRAKGISGIDAVFAIGSNGDTDRWLQQYLSVGSTFYEYEQGTPPIHSITIGTPIKSSCGRINGDNACALNGAIVQTDTYSGTYNPVFLKIGASGDPNRILNGTIARLAYFPTRKTDQELVNMTS